MKQLSKDEVQHMVEPKVWDVLQAWLDLGKGIAVYQNHDLGHAQVGHRQFVSYGTPEAQIETDTPPERLPDIGTSINFRYILEGVYRGSGRE